MVHSHASALARGGSLLLAALVAVLLALAPSTASAYDKDICPATGQPGAWSWIPGGDGRCVHTIWYSTTYRVTGQPQVDFTAINEHCAVVKTQTDGGGPNAGGITAGCIGGTNHSDVRIPGGVGGYAVLVNRDESGHNFHGHMWWH